MTLACQLEALGIAVVHDDRGLTHAWNADLGVPHCCQRIIGPRTLPGAGDRDCLHCRQIPGYARQYLRCGEPHPY
jgi:hypothetical protein